MIEYKVYNHKEDFQAVLAYCKKFGFAFPSSSEQIWLAIKDSEIIGISAVGKIYKIEPLISENPIVANKLGQMAIGYAIGTGIKTITATVPGKNVKHTEQLVKEGFSVIDTNITILEKKYG